MGMQRPSFFVWGGDGIGENVGLKMRRVGF